MIAQLIYSGSLLNEPLHCWDEVIGPNLPDVASECGLPPLVVIELLDGPDLSSLPISEGLRLRVEGSSVLPVVPR